MLKEMIDACGVDVFVWTKDNGNCIRIDIDDFEGFDENGKEVFREYENSNAIDELMIALKQNAIKIDEDFYLTYYFEGFNVCVGFTSFDI